MRERIQEWAPYLAALGVALWAAVAVLYLIGNLQANVALGLIALGIFFFALYLMNRPREVRQAVTGRTAIYGSNVIVMSLAFVGIVAAVLFIVDRTPALHARWDVTAAKSRSLSQLTVKVLQDLQEPVTVTGFFRPDDTQRADFDTRLKDYQYYSSKLIYRVVDPDSNPALAQEYDISQAGTVVVERGSGPSSRKEKIYQSDENTITNAILKVVQTQQKVVYFTTGHGEHILTSFDDPGLNSARDLLTQVNYRVDVLNMATVTNTVTISGTSPVSGSLPFDTSAVVIAGPTKPFSTEDAARIKEYLDHGGRVMILADIDTDPGLKDMLAAWGVDLHNDLVLDPALNYRGNAVIPVITSFPGHPVTRNLDQYGMFLPGARAVTASTNPPADRSPLVLFQTTASACGKTDLEALKTTSTIPPCDATKDEKGPLSLGVLVEANVNPNDPNVKGRLIVVGNSSMMTNAVMRSQDSAGNQIFFMNAIDWLTGQEDLIAIPAKDQTAPQLGLLTGTDQNLILWSNVLLLPVATLLIGGIIWWRRR